MTDPKIIGCLIQATAPKRRPRKGVLLPPKPGPRSISYRLAVDGKTPAPFNPNEWTITVLAGPVYSHDNLPAMHLATRTMLKAEQRRQPADEDAWIAEYKVYRGTALLYAVADTVPMTGLTPARADAWTKARTCVRCTKQFPRPLAASPQQERYCQPCHELAARERWTEQARAVQADAAAWAREVLDDPRTVLLTDDQYPNAGRGRGYRAETIAGQILADVRVRAFDGSYDDVRYPDSWSPEQIAAESLGLKYGTFGARVNVARRQFRKLWFAPETAPPMRGTDRRIGSRATELRTHCSAGHELTPENTYWRPDRRRSRFCKTCEQARGIARVAARRELVAG